MLGGLFIQRFGDRWPDVRSSDAATRQLTMILALLIRNRVLNLHAKLEYIETMNLGHAVYQSQCKLGHLLDGQGAGLIDHSQKLAKRKD